MSIDSLFFNHLQYKYFKYNQQLLSIIIILILFNYPLQIITLSQKIFHYQLNQRLSVWINQTMKKALSKFDLFAALPILRAEGETEVNSICGGIFSTVMFAFITYLFISSIITMIRLENITATQLIQMNRPTNQSIGNLTIGVGLQWMNLSALRNIFQVRAFTVQRSTIYNQMSVFPCTRQYWSSLDDTKYKTLGLSGYMCFQRQGVQIFGQNGSPDLRLLYFNLTQCDNATSPVTCAPPATINFFLTNYMIFGRFFSCSLAILDASINPNNQNPLSFTAYQKTLWLLFNKNQFNMVQIFLGTYQIETDTNFFPWITKQKKFGYFVTQSIMTDFVNANSLTIFIQAYFFTSPINKLVSRTYGKIDEVLSYVGGLFSIIVSFFAFFLMSYNQYKYELRVSEGAFSFNQAHLARQSNFHFGKYLKYSLFVWIKTLFCCELNWEDCKAIDSARQQAIQQIDVKHLLQRISHLQQVIELVVNANDQTVLYVSELNSIDQVRKRRAIVEYYNKFSESDKNITINAFKSLDAVLMFGLSLKQKSSNSIIYPQHNNQSLQFQNQQCQQLEENRNSIAIMSEYVEKYKQKFNITESLFELKQQDLNAQKQVAQAFYNLEQKIRKKLIYKIPLGILYRLNSYKQLYQTNESHKPKLRKSLQLGTGDFLLKPLKNTLGSKKQRKLEEGGDSTIQFKNQ